MSFTLFIALFLILLGVGYLIKSVAKIEIPMPRYSLGVFIVLIGVHFLIVQLDKNDEESISKVWFSHRNFAHHISEQNEYTIVFGESTIDLSGATLNDSLPRVKIEVVFGHATVYLPDSIPYKIKSSIAFGGTDGNGPNNGGIGEYYAQSEDFSPNANYLTIHTDVVFGGLTWR